MTTDPKPCIPVPLMRRFIAEIADLDIEGEPILADDPNSELVEWENDEAHETLMGLIIEARQILGRTQ